MGLDLDRRDLGDVAPTLPTSARSLGEQTIISGRTEYAPAGQVVKRYDDYTMAATADPLTPATPNNGFVTYEYCLNGSGYTDPLGRVHRVTQTDGTTRTTTYTGFTTTFYDEQNHKTRTIADHLGRTDVFTGTGPSYVLYGWTTYTYDGAGRVLTSQQNFNTNTRITIAYDTLGRKTSMVDPDSGTWQYAYDAGGNLLVQQDPKTGQRVQFCYDGLNRVTRKLYLTDDTLTPISCTNTAGIDWIEYTYDTGTNGKGHLTMVTETRADATVTTTMAYDLRGRVTSEAKTISIVSPSSSRSATTAYAYDGSNADKVATVTYPDGEIVTTIYDQSGHPKVLAGSTSYVTDLQYDIFGRPTAIVHANGTKDTREYYGTPENPDTPAFSKGHRLKLVKKTSTPTDTHLNLSYGSYTPRGFLQQLSDLRDGAGMGLSNSATFGYDDLGRLTSAWYAYNGANHTYGYDSLGNMTSKEGTTYTYGSATKPHQVTAVGGVSLGYDANGNRQSKGSWAYGYDKDDRLSTVNTSAVKFVYDYSGRRVAKVAGSSITRYYNDLLESTDGQLTKYYYLARIRVAAQRVNSQYALAPDAAVQVASTSALRPAVVLLVRRDVQLGAAFCVLVLGTALVFAPWRRQRVVGIAVRHGQVIAVLVAFGVGTLPWPLLLRPLGPAVAAAQTPPLLVHFHLDHLGSVQVITQSDGTRFRQVRYRAYGDVRRYNGSGGSGTDCTTDRYCHEFTGYDTEPISGLDYAGARFYDPALGLFMTHDPARQFGSPYAYGPWNPLNGTDPTGAFWAELFALAAAAFVVGFATTTVQAVASGASAGEALKAGAISGAISGAAVIGLGVIGSASVLPTLAPAISAASVVAGVSSIVGGLQSGNYVSAGVGASLLAFGLLGVLSAVMRSARGRTLAQRAGSSRGARRGLWAPQCVGGAASDATARSARASR